MRKDNHGIHSFKSGVTLWIDWKINAKPGSLKEDDVNVTIGLTFFLIIVIEWSVLDNDASNLII